MATVLSSYGLNVVAHGLQSILPKYGARPTATRDIVGTGVARPGPQKKKQQTITGRRRGGESGRWVRRDGRLPPPDQHPETGQSASPPRRRVQACRQRQSQTPSTPPLARDRPPGRSGKSRARPAYRRMRLAAPNISIVGRLRLPPPPRPKPNPVRHRSSPKNRAEKKGPTPPASARSAGPPDPLRPTARRAIHGDPEKFGQIHRNTRDIGPPGHDRNSRPERCAHQPIVTLGPARVRGRPPSTSSLCPWRAIPSFSYFRPTMKTGCSAGRTGEIRRCEHSSTKSRLPSARRLIGKKARRCWRTDPAIHPHDLRESRVSDGLA